jgi:hypothetical protein
MKSVREFIAKIFDIHDCVRDIGGYRTLVELGLILFLILLFSLPAIMW